MGLYNHQKQFLEENPNKSTLVWSCGTGKTRTAIEWSNSLRHNFPSTLVICPKALKANWYREIMKNIQEHTLRGVPYKLLSKEEFRRDHKKLGGFHQIIVDEVHNGFLTPLFKSQMSKALRWYIDHHKVPRVLLLSATVYTSSPWNIFNLAYYTGHNWNWRKFKDTFFYDVQMGHRRIPMVKKGSDKKLAELVKKIASVVDIHDVLDVPLQNHLEPEYFALTTEQKKAIKDNYDPVPIVRYTMQHEIENGILLGNEFRGPQTYETDKIERIKAICEENKKVAIVCRYNKQIDSLERELSRHFEKSIFIIRGDVKDRDKVTQLSEEAKEAIVLIQADCAEGYELPSFEVCVFASMSYAYTKFEQICGRFLRMNKPSRTTFIYLLTEGDSIDQAVYDAIKRKEDFQINLYKK